MRAVAVTIPATVATKLPARWATLMTGLIRPSRPTVVMGARILRFDKHNHCRRDTRCQTTDLLETFPPCRIDRPIVAHARALLLVVRHLLTFQPLKHNRGRR
jgi:hypothetical protein